MTLRVEKDPTCFGCGEENPVGLHLRFEPDGDLAARARYVASPQHTGWRNVVHGGVLFTLMDEGFGWMLWFGRIEAVTAKVETRFLKPVAVGSELAIRSWVTGQRRKLYDARSEITDIATGTIVADAKALMFRVSGA